MCEVEVIRLLAEGKELRNFCGCQTTQSSNEGMKRIASGYVLSSEFHAWIQAQGVEIASTNLMPG